MAQEKEPIRAKLGVDPVPVWKYDVGNVLKPMGGFGVTNRTIIQRMVDVDTKQRFYRFTLEKAGTAIDSALLMEDESRFEKAPPSVMKPLRKQQGSIHALPRFKA